MLTAESNGIARIQMPELKSSESISLVLKVSDNGTPWLVSYKRILIVNPVK
ncbi:MAG: hypothetical protein HC830_01805 [Bacteroidetes bacterium]|nr:hypothetical protein [Bacteroidota bacterium]